HPDVAFGREHAELTPVDDACAPHRSADTRGRDGIAPEHQVLPLAEPFDELWMVNRGSGLVADARQNANVALEERPEARWCTAPLVEPRSGFEERAALAVGPRAFERER